MRKLLRRLARSVSGNFTVITALSLVPVIGMAGLGMDYSQAYSVWTTLQGEADAIAIAVASEGPAGKSRFYDAMTAAATNRVALGRSRFTGRWTSQTDYEVSASADVPRSFSRLIPGGGATIPVSTRSVARYTGAQLAYKQPQRTSLDPDADDYNQIYAYCFDPEKAKTNRAAARSKQVAIADNLGQAYDSPMPQCGSAEIMSYALINVLGGIDTPSNRRDNSKARYYLTDTTRDAMGRDVHSLPHDMLETILCKDLSECRDRPLGIIPTGKNRTPRKTTLKCEPGKYMYYGWDDWSARDGDYNDVRIILACPTNKLGDGNVRLIN